MTRKLAGRGVWALGQVLLQLLDLVGLLDLVDLVDGQQWYDAEEQHEQ
ncbi:MAG: hypothetical protein IMZ75_04140 [Actinobacteria bacterium]|nr:hypothetical protein [Actinomycetota bacterium]